MCHIRIITGGVGAIIPGLPGVGSRAVTIGGMVAVIAGARIVAGISIAGIVAVITGAGIVAGIFMVRIVAVIPVGVGIAVTPPIRRVYPSDPEPAMEMPKTMVEPATVETPFIAMKTPASAAAMSGIDRLWLNNSGGKQEYRCGTP